MDTKQYAILALRTAADRSQQEKLLEAVMGLGGEAGEIVDMLKKSRFYGKPLERAKVIEELGDLLWYANLLIHANETTWEEVFEVNIRKLETRFPNLKFEADKAINRDVVAEKAVIDATAAQ